MMMSRRTIKIMTVPVYIKIEEIEAVYYVGRNRFNSRDNNSVDSID